MHLPGAICSSLTTDISNLLCSLDLHVATRSREAWRTPLCVSNRNHFRFVHLGCVCVEIGEQQVPVPELHTEHSEILHTQSCYNSKCKRTDPSPSKRLRSASWGMPVPFVSPPRVDPSKHSSLVPALFEDPAVPAAISRGNAFPASTAIRQFLI